MVWPSHGVEETLELGSFSGLNPPVAVMVSWDDEETIVRRPLIT
jgi:hypothetical protein